MVARSKFMTIWFVSGSLAISVILVAVTLIRWNTDETLAVEPRPTTDVVDLEASTIGETQPRWSYFGEHDGQTKWAELSPDYLACDAGRMQSPVNIEETLRGVEAQALEITYPVQELIVHFGSERFHGTFGQGGTLTIGARSFDLKSFKVTAPAEHSIEGRALDLELQLFHENDAGERLVLSLLFESGSAHMTLGKLLEPIEEFPNVTEAMLELAVQSLLPKSRGYYRYIGSETTPPCGEGVEWIILRETASLSFKQLEAFLSTIGKSGRERQDYAPTVHTYD